MKKKYVSILLAGCMAVSMMTPAGAVWADENPVVAAQGTVQGEKTAEDQEMITDQQPETEEEKPAEEPVVSESQDIGEGEKETVAEEEKSGDSLSTDNNAENELEVQAATNRWVRSGNRWWYCHRDGSYTKDDWEAINGVWYYFDQSGWMVTGWKQIGGDWYYFQTSGAMIGQGWHVINGKWYYMYANGVMASNTWIDSDYVDSSGAWLYRADKKCRTVYAQFLRNKGYLNQEKGNKDPRFIMFDMNGDKVPELVIIHNINHLSGGYIYTYSTDGNVSYAGWVYGLYGSVAAYPSAGLIESAYAHQGTDLEEYFSLENGTLVSKGRWISSYLNGTQWYLNDVQTSQSRYEKWKAEHVTGDSVCLTYDTMYSITEKNIRTYLDW